jgi:hypothetical protein
LQLTTTTNDDDGDLPPFPIHPTPITPRASQLRTQTPHAARQQFIEKYRPMKLDDVVGNNDTIERLRVIAQHGNMPNLMYVFS